MSKLLQHIEAEIIDQYMQEDNRPWIIGFSGGKDSTMMLQMVWYALRKIPVEFRPKRKIYIVCNDTLVENPKIVEFIDKTLNNIVDYAVKEDIQMLVEKTQPRLEDTFWVNLLGRGYPAPNNSFRWCTERLKINPTTKRILEKISENGEVIILLGTRTDESSKRAQSMKKHRFGTNRLRKHPLPKAFVYSPIEDVTTEEVWQYLLQVPSPWGLNNRDLVTLYRNASGGDCPLVIDTTTPSCGNSRFGCWVCTVVKKDSSMEALIENGEDWLYPMLEVRDLLAESRDNLEWREDKRRNGQDAPGPYKPEYRAKLLERLLAAQYEVQKVDPEIDLISNQELIAIQIVWYRDSIFNYRVSEIYNNAYKYNIMKADKNEEQKKKENNILQSICKKNPEHVQLINDMLELQKSKTLMQKKRGLADDLENQLERFLNKHKAKAL